MRHKKAQLEDRIGRSFGILGHARIMSSEEAMRLISDVRLGIDLGIIHDVSHETLNELMVATRPAFLQRSVGREISHFERDVLRANLIRQHMPRGAQT